MKTLAPDSPVQNPRPRQTDLLRLQNPGGVR